MKQKIISLLLLFIATCSWAQDKNTSASDEKQRIPIKPIIVEGELTGVPDGTPIQFPVPLRLIRSDLRHQLTHQSIHADLWLCETPERPALPEGFIWIPESSLPDYALPRLIHNLLE